MTQCRIMGWLGATVLAVLVGCGEAGIAPTAKVTGTVTVDGSPAGGVIVTFTPVPGSKTAGRMANATADASGKYSLTSFKPNDGAMPGEYVVGLSGPGAPATMPEMRKKVEEGKANVIDITVTK